MRILIVDDNTEIVLLLKAMLPKAEVMDSCSNGREAVEAVRSSLRRNVPYTLICLDILMPEMDGHQALKEIRSLEVAHGIDFGDGAKVIMITALGDGKNVFGAFHREGCDGYIVKPFERADIWKTLEQLELV